MQRTAHTLPPREEMLTAFADRDASYDGLFFGAVTTTGVFCKPSCPARNPRPEHLVFYATAREALFAGFRPCRRCHPLEEAERTPEWAARLMAEVEAHPDRRIRERELRARGLDPAVVRRYFKATYGMTFQVYSRSRRLGDAFAAIRDGVELDQVILGHGWDSHSGFREAFGKAAGAPPGKVAAAGTAAPPSTAGADSTSSASGAARPSGRPYKAGAAPADFIRLGWIETPLGPMVAGATQRALCLLEFTDLRMMEAQLDTLRNRYRLPLLAGESPLFDELRTQLTEYFAGGRQTFAVPLDYPGTDFQRRVWDALQRIPYGETRTYSGLAAELGVPNAARAVGRANGFNRISILIPCHRVIAADSGLGGYGGGLWRKLRLLETEGARPAPSTG